MPVKGCESYVWFTEKILGESTNGQTYFGRNKVTGMPCVIKLPRENIEINEKLRKINNENVVKFLGTEYTKYKELVIVFEYCDEYSLLKLLEKPENFYGLNDNNIVHLFEHTINGLKFLTNIGLPKSYYLKPSNVLCVREWDGNITFKISDYLFEIKADVYCINMIPKKVDILIWSFGSLLCHAILGSSPFEIIEQSKSSEVINSKKEDHIFISSSGWQSSFPNTVQLTPSLRRALIGIIRDCLSFKIDSKRLYNYKIRSSNSDAIVYAFDTRSLSHFAIICKDGTCTFIDTTFSKSQKMLFNQKSVKNVDELNPSKERISMDDPAFFYISRAEAKVEEHKSALDEIYSNLKKLTTDDINFARNCNAFVIFCSRLLDKIILSKKGMKQICNVLADEASIKLDTIKLKLTISKSLNKQPFQDLLGLFEEFRNKINEIYAFDTPDHETVGQSSSRSSDSGIGSSHASSRHGTSHDNLLQCHGAVKELVESTSKIYHEFRQDSNKELTHNDVQVHKYEKVKLKEYAKKTFQLLSEQLHFLNDHARQFNEIIDGVYSECKSEVIEKFDRMVSTSILKSEQANPPKSDSESITSRQNFIGQLDKSIDIFNEMTKEFEAILIKIT